MSVTREIVAFRLIGDSSQPVFVIMPRMVGMIVSMICLTFYFDVVAIVGGYMVAKVQLTVPFYAFVTGVIAGWDCPTSC